MKKRLGKRFDQPVNCRNSLQNINEKYLSITILSCPSYPEKSVRLSYFLAASEYFSELDCFDHDIALNLRPNGGLIGIDNSSLDKYLKVSKILRLHAFLHDAGGFIFGTYNQGPGYTYMLPWISSNCFSGHLSGIFFCLYIKIFHLSIFSLIVMLSSKTVVLDVEGFRQRNEIFIVKEFGICSEDYLDCVSFLPPTSLCEFTTQQQQSFGWLRAKLHGMDWDIGNYP